LRLTKLELSGFKSFARKTELAFGQGITAVIGPNGSGKSNIADAIRWVLGEQSARALRGSKMEDVIFNGTQQRKSQGYCEVTLTFDNADGKLKLPYSEIAVTRRLYRSGESEYCLNRSGCRLRDIQDLFRDTGIGKDGYSIISQGKVDEILSNRSNDRRVALEEAAGVMRYRVRKEEAARKLEHTEKNLERINDILEELEARLGPLEEQSAAARRYLKLRDELKELEVNQFLYQYDRAKERLLNAEKTISQVAEQETATEAQSELLLTACQDLEQRSRELDVALTAQQTHLMQLLSGVESQVGESKVLFERHEHSKQEIARLEQALETAVSRVQELSETLRRMESDTTASAAMDQLNRDIAAAESELSGRDASLLEAENALEEMKNSIMEAMNRLADARGDLSRYDAMQTAIASRMESIRAEMEQAGGVSDALRDEYEQAQESLKQQRSACEHAQTLLTEAQENREALRKEYEAAQQQYRMLEQETDRLSSRLRVLNDMEKSHEGYYASVRSILQAAEKEPRLRSAMIGVVAELVRVPKEYETAIHMALGSALQNIVTSTADDARFVIEYLRTHDYGRATLLPMALLRERPVTAQERSLLASDGCMGIASELIDFDSAAERAVNYLLGRTVLVKDLASGVELKKKSGGAFQIATLDGDIISTGGAMSGGSTKKNGFSLLGRKRELEDIAKQLAAKKDTLSDLAESCEEKRKAILMAELQIDAFREELHQQQIELTKLEEKTDIIARDVESGCAAGSRLAEELSALEENLRDIAAEREEALALQNRLESGSTATRDDVRHAQQQLASMRQERELASAALTDQKIRRMALEKEQAAVETEYRRLALEKEQSEQSAAQLQISLEENQSSLSEISARISEMQKLIETEQQNAEEQKKTQQGLEEERESLNASLTEHRARRDALLAELRELSERKHKQELLYSRTEMELTAMQDRIWEEYELTYENALPLRREMPIGATSSRITSIRTEIRDMGDINLGAIEDYKAVSERFSTLSTQRDDLYRAETDLAKLIDELTGTMEKVFHTQFTIIQKNFAEVFTELFGGGHAELRLSDPNDVLGCDIDIIAQPPGKKLQLLSLLSGGERALTAIALLFAMLRLKPPAFCVLDEIESSLDEANVTRFADYLKAYSDDTQFIIITHRKGSMEVCDSLYGVSMEERGISKVVSARFGTHAS